MPLFRVWLACGARPGFILPSGRDVGDTASWGIWDGIQVVLVGGVKAFSFAAVGAEVAELAVVAAEAGFAGLGGAADFAGHRPNLSKVAAKWGATGRPALNSFHAATSSTASMPWGVSPESSHHRGSV